MAVGVLLALMVLHKAASAGAIEAAITIPAHFVWPISGSSTPDLPLSSAYGPRLRAGCGHCYDYHQGIDIPAPVGTTLVAVMQTLKVF